MKKRSRIKALGGEAIYHCISRLIPEVPYWNSRAKEVMRKQLWRTADFSGIQILTYCLMGNHLHILIRVPDRETVQVSDSELLRRYKVLYPKPTRYERARIEELEQALHEDGHKAGILRARLLARMHDVSAFMKTLKHRYTLWYNRSHDRYGTIWAERFRSVLVQNTPLAALTMAAYIDLNPVRAGLVQDPKDYRWCGYAEAVAGREEARAGLAALTGHSATTAPADTTPPGKSPDKALQSYRTLLFGKGAVSAPGKQNAASIDPDLAAQVLKTGGKLPAHHLLCCRVRYFTEGLIIGTHDYVQKHLEERCLRGETRRCARPRPIAPDAWKELTFARNFRQ